MTTEYDSDGNESMAVESGTMALLQRSEIDTQIATAHQFPRVISKFIAEATKLVTLDEATANECSYALPRDGKVIAGPSARFAEIIASTWGNMRSGARVVDDTGKFVVAQGVAHDLERNNATTMEIQRRVTGKDGRRYKDDMIGVTGNAACSIAHRNAVLKVVPKALWAPIYETALKVIRGDVKTLSSRRAAAIEYATKLGAVPGAIFAALGVGGIDDITLDHLVVLKGTLQAIKDGDSNIDDAFPVARKGAESLNEKMKEKKEAPPAKTAQEGAGEAPAGEGAEAGAEGAAPAAGEPAQAQEAKPARAKRAPKAQPEAQPSAGAPNLDLE